MSKKGPAPIRTCIGCRKRRKKEEMIWLTLSSQGVVKVNPRTPHQGRGFYLCPDLGCVHRAKKKNRGVGVMETLEFQVPLGKSIFKERDERDRGGRE
jgi:predicted RNA-binding protein YlxR (DUF448 family)